MPHPSTPIALRYLHHGLEIPKDIQTEILPDQKVSILDLLKYPFPPISTVSHNISSVSAFFSQAEPTVGSVQDMVSIVQGVPMPSMATITALGEACKMSNLDFRSVVCPHLH
jgi:hypothetical protein